MKDEKDDLDEIFEALASRHRRAIIYRLSLQPISISQLAKERRLSLPAIHKHIEVLERAEFLLRKKSGRCNFLALNRKALLNLKDWISQFNPYWGSNKETLANYVLEIQKNINLK